MGGSHYLKAKAVLIDSSELFIREYNSIDSYLYSYHWQDESGLLRIRWDNAPHHQELENYPHHLHLKGETRSSTEPYFMDILKNIEKKLKKRN